MDIPGERWWWCPVRLVLPRRKPLQTGSSTGQRWLYLIEAGRVISAYSSGDIQPLSLYINIILCNVAGKGLFCLLREQKRESAREKATGGLSKLRAPLWIRVVRERTKMIIKAYFIF